MEGTLSYNAALGAKWELLGLGNAQGTQFPFTWQGRGFFKSHWIESEMQFGEASCKISGEGTWNMECRALRSEQAAFLQAGAAVFYGAGVLAFGERPIGWEGGLFLHVVERPIRRGKHRPAQRPLFAGLRSVERGPIAGWGEPGRQREGVRDQSRGRVGRIWNAEARVWSLQFSLHGGWDGEKFPIQIEKGIVDDFRFAGRGWIDPDLDLAFSLNGEGSFVEKKIPFYCPNFSKRGSDWAFDFRFVRELGTCSGWPGPPMAKRSFTAKRAIF